MLEIGPEIAGGCAPGHHVCGDVALLTSEGADAVQIGVAVAFTLGALVCGRAV